MTHRTPKAERERNPFKPDFHREPVKDTPTLKPADGDARPGPGANGLRPFSPKRWDALKKAGKTVSSTFGGTKVATGPHQGLRRRLSPSEGHPERATPKRLRAGETALRSLDRVKILKPIGRRGRRLATGDRKQEAITHKMRCCCGCMDHREPEPGEVSRAHLESRAYEATRNIDANNLPACYWLAHWLDHEPGGVKCKVDLLEMAKQLQRRPTDEEVRPLLKTHSYYDWRATAFRI